MSFILYLLNFLCQLISNRNFITLLPTVTVARELAVLLCRKRCKVTPNLRGCLPEKYMYSYARCFLGNHHKLYIDKKVIKCRNKKIISYFSYPSAKAKEADKHYNHKNYNFLNCDWFKLLLFSTNSLAKLLSDSLLLDSLLSDSLLLDSLLSDSSISQSHSKL